MKPCSRTLIAAITKYTFQDEALLELALTHSSCDRPTGDNQRLEFLGVDGFEHLIDTIGYRFHVCFVEAATGHRWCT